MSKIMNLTAQNSSSWITDDLKDYSETAILIFHGIGGFLEFFMVLAFVNFIFKKKLPEYHGFIILLSVGYIQDLLCLVSWDIDLIHGYENQFWLQATELTFIYAVMGGSLWNTLLSLNRCVAVLWPTKHSKYWSIKMICCLYVPAIIVYPFVLQGYQLFDPKFWKTEFDVFSSDTSVLISIRLVIGISDTLLALLMLFMTTIVYIKSRSSAIKRTQKWDRNMLLHCAFSSFFMSIFSLSYWLAAFFHATNPEATYIFEYFALLMYGIFHYGSIIILLMINSSIRNGILRFYTCGAFGGPKIVRVNTVSNFSLRRASQLILLYPKRRISSISLF